MELTLLKNKILVIILFAVVFSSYGQKRDSLYQLSGQIRSMQGDYPVALAHVINKTQQWGVVADTLGYFEIWVKDGDSLNISAIGFDFTEYKVRGFLRDSLVKIKLVSRYYEIPEVAISYLGTYKQFEQKVIDLELPDLGINPEFNKLFKYVEPPPNFMEPQVTSPASLIYVLFSKDAKDKAKYIELEKRGKVKEKVKERYNAHIIKNLTGLDGNEAYQFMKFCDFTDEDILSLNEYNLYKEILSKYEDYKNIDEDSLFTE